MEMLRRSYWEYRVNPDSPHASRDRQARSALGSDLAAAFHERPAAVHPGCDPGRHAAARPASWGSSPLLFQHFLSGTPRRSRRASHFSRATQGPAVPLGSMGFFKPERNQKP